MADGSDDDAQEAPDPVPAPLETRRAALETLASEPWDLVIVGGGIVGCGALLDATSRGLRAALIEVIETDFVDLARLKGIRRTRLYLRHVLRNALGPAVTILGLNIGFLLSGLVIIENVFALPGLGSELVDSIFAHDYPEIQALTLVFGVAVVAINLLTDLAYAKLDPRVRL